MKVSALDVERTASRVHATALTLVQYPVLWTTPFLDLALVAHGIQEQFPLVGDLAWPMAAIVELAGVHLGCEWMDARTEHARLRSTPGAKARQARGREIMALGLFGVYFATVGTFVYLSAGPLGLFFPALAATVIVSAANKMQRQLRQDQADIERAERKAERERRKAEREAERAAQEAERVERETEQAAQGNRTELSKAERIRLYRETNPDATVRDIARTLSMPVSTVQYHVSRLNKRAAQDQE